MLARENRDCMCVGVQTDRALDGLIDSIPARSDGDATDEARER
jgi:hypothetical protein